MFAKGFQMLLRRHGQEAEIRRQGTLVTQTKALVNDKEGYLSFLPGTDIQAGDEVFFSLSEKLYAVEQVEKSVAGNILISLNAHFPTPLRRGRSPIIVHGSVITAGTISNSAIQQHSPNATQTVTFGVDQTEKVKGAIRLILEVLDDLDLSEADKAEIRSEAETADAQLKSPKPRWEWIKTSLSNLRDKVVSGITEKVTPAIVAKAEQAIEWISGTQNVGG